MSANAWWSATIGPEANSNTTAAIATILRTVLVLEFIVLYYETVNKSIKFLAYSAILYTILVKLSPRFS